jgi:murein L,D-transpeptidase YafK
LSTFSVDGHPRFLGQRMIRRTLYVSIAVLTAILMFGLVFRFWPREPLDQRLTADSVLVAKSERRLALLKDGKVIRTYRVALGKNPFGPKTQQGDGRTPEGLYRIDGRNAGSGFFRALHISYPSAADREGARKDGVSAGGDIMIHGIKNGFGWVGRLHRLVDWTNGCIAVTDEEMREIWNAVPNNIPIEIRP